MSQRLRKVRIVGAGLLGTSLALALKGEGVEIELSDTNEAHLALARDLVGPTAHEGDPDLVVLAIPSSAFKEVIEEEYQLNPHSAFIDLGSTKTQSLVDIEVFTEIAARFCGTHPMAGRENGGPHGARSDLFQGRPWLVCATSITTGSVIELVEELIARVGGIAIPISAPEHDRAVALISHLPQLVSSLLAKQLLDGPENWLALAGQGLRDTTRIAASDPELWKGILSENKEQLRPLLETLRNDLNAAIAGLDDPFAIETIIAQGKAGQARIPGKHGGKSREYTYLPIVIEDKPGQLAALFDACSHVNVNVEDLTIEHSPGQFTGLITLALSSKDSELLSHYLRTSGWNVHSSRGPSVV